VRVDFQPASWNTSSIQAPGFSACRKTLESLSKNPSVPSRFDISGAPPGPDPGGVSVFVDIFLRPHNREIGDLERRQQAKILARSARLIIGRSVLPWFDRQSGSLENLIR
jgi:hypothetical protein